MNAQYYTKLCKGLSENEWKDCAALFSENYGVYSGKGSQQKGERIKLSPRRLKIMYGDNDDMYVSLCYLDGKLLGDAFFLRKKIEPLGFCAWVTQLVVDSKYRNRRIGTKLLQSAWGFSDYYAWGLATANAITLRTLESVTWRKIDAREMLSNKRILEQLAEIIPFVDSKAIKLTERQSQIFSDFYPELEKSNDKADLNIYATRLGEIEPGNEWLAFTFKSQDMEYDDEKFKSFLNFSESQLQEAYSRMDMPAQKWTKGTDREIEYILSEINIDKKAKILDIGCGQGRHIINLAKRGFENLVGVDFSESNIQKAKIAANEMSLPQTSFICGDARGIRLGSKYDLILCLYDVVGSFREDKENVKILKTIKSNLKKDGYAIISVMNMELTEHISIHKCSLSENPKALLQLPPSDTMAVSGNVFNPDFFLINTDDDLVYRKEQFMQDDKLATEYVIVDRRFRMQELTDLVTSLGFKVLTKRYVQAGRFDLPLSATDSKAKEILMILTLE